jgi:hypothetical protein
MDKVFRNNLMFLERKNPLMNFKLRNSVSLNATLRGDIILSPQEDIVVVYRLASFSSLTYLLELLKTAALQVIVFEKSLEEAAYFMAFEEMGELLQCRGFQWYLLEDLTQELALTLAWETVFLKKRIVTAFVNEDFIRFKEQMTGFFDAVFLSASEYSDYGVKVLSNFYKNLPFATQSGRGSRLKCPGIPIVICGAGPSLGGQMALLKELQHKAIIFAGGSVVSALIQQGVEPHLVALVDPDSTAHQGLGSQVSEVPVIYQMRVCHEVLKNIHGLKIFSESSFQHPIENYVLEKLEVARGSLESGWHVGNFMATIAAEMGCHPIVLVGMDMVYKGEVEYVEGVYVEEEKAQVEAPCLTMQGERAFSRKDLLMGRDFFSDLVTRYPKSCFINATLEGLSISHMEHKTLQEMMETWPQQDLKGRLHSYFQALETIDFTAQEVTTLFCELQESILASENYLQHMLRKLQGHSLHPQGFSHIALEEIELEEEIVYKNYLEPLWHIWKWIVLRHDQKSVHTVEGKIQQIVFYLDVLRKHKVLLEGV